MAADRRLTKRGSSPAVELFSSWLCNEDILSLRRVNDGCLPFLAGLSRSCGDFAPLSMAYWATSAEEGLATLVSANHSDRCIAYTAKFSG